MLRRLFRKTHDTAYDEYRYWNSRADPNSPGGWSEAFRNTNIEYIRKHTAEARDILELGPGVGRTFDAYTPDKSVVGVDITRGYSERAEARAANLRFNYRCEVLKSPSEKLSYRDQEFDVAVCCQVFLHMKPKTFLFMFGELFRVSKAMVVISGGSDKNPAPHVFAHDYLSTLTSLGGAADDVLYFPPHIYFLGRRR